MGGINMMKVFVVVGVAGLVLNLGNTVIHSFLFTETSASTLEAIGVAALAGTVPAIF